MINVHQQPDAEHHNGRSTGTNLQACRHEVATDRSHHTSTPRFPASVLSSVLSPQSHLKRLLIQYGFGKQLLEPGVLFLKRRHALNLGHLNTAILLTPGVKGGVRSMACLRQSSRAETPASASRRILMICWSEKRFFMGMSSCGL